jgi:hypothetical protein
MRAACSRPVLDHDAQAEPRLHHLRHDASGHVGWSPGPNGTTSLIGAIEIGLRERGYVTSPTCAASKHASASSERRTMTGYRIMARSLPRLLRVGHSLQSASSARCAIASAIAGLRRVSSAASASCAIARSSRAEVQLRSAASTAALRLK